MNSLGSSSDCVGAFFGEPDAVCLRCMPLGFATFSATRIRRVLKTGEDFGVTIPAQDSYFLMLYLSDTVICDVAADESRSHSRHFRRGSICLMNLRCGARISVHMSLDAVAFVIPYALIDELAALSTPGSHVELRCLRGKPDPVLANLGTALLPVFLQDPQAVDAMLRHLAMAICAHVLHHYRRSPLSSGRGRDEPFLH